MSAGLVIKHAKRYERKLKTSTYTHVLIIKGNLHYEKKNCFFYNKFIYSAISVCCLRYPMRYIIALVFQF